MASSHVLDIEVRAAVSSAVEQLQQLGHELGGNVGAKAQELSERLSRLAAHSDAITFFREMQAEASQAEQKYRKLSAELVEYERQLGTSTDPRHVARLEQLRKEVSAASEGWERSRQQLSVATRQMYEWGTSAGTVERAQARLRKEMEAGNTKALALVQRMRDMGAGVSAWERLARGAANSVTGTFRQMVEAVKHVPKTITSISDKFGQLYNVLAAKVTFGGLVGAVQSMQDVRASLQAVTGDARSAGEQFEFVKRVAMGAGSDIAESAQQWVKLSAAAKGTALEGKAAQDVFKAVTNAMSNMGQSGAQTGAVLQTLTQIINGEDVSARQLERTLGTQLPGALQAAAAGFGVTEAELRKMLDAGEVTAENLLPALAKGLHDTTNAAPAVAKVSDAVQNLKNAIGVAADELGGGGFAQGLVEGANIAGAAIMRLTDNVIRGGQLIGATFSALVNMDFSNYKQALLDITEESNQRLARMAQDNEYVRKSIELVGSDSQKAAVAAADLAAKQGEAGAAAAAAAPELDKLGMSYKQLDETVGKIKDTQKSELEVLQARTKAAEQQAQQAGLTAEAQLAAQEKLAAARQAEAQHYETIARAKEADLQKAQQQLEATQKAAAASEEEAGKLAPAIENLKKLVTQREQDALKAREQAKANSEEAKALEAQAKVLDAANKARKAESDATIKTLEAQKETARIGEELARLAGNDYEARRLKIQQLEIEIEIIRAKVAAQRAEAEYEIASANAKRAHLLATGQLTEATRAEIDASIKMAQAKQQQSDAVEKSIKLQERAVQQMRLYGNETSNAAQQSQAATSAAAGGWREVASEAGAARDAVEGYSSSVRGAPSPPSAGNVGANNHSPSGRTRTATRHTWMSLYNRAKEFGAPEELARQLADAQFDATGKRTNALQSRYKKGKNDYFSDDEAVRRAVEQWMRNNPQTTTTQNTTQNDGQTTKNTQRSTAQGITTVNINLNGKRTALNMADATSAHQLENLLREIANDQERAV